MGKKLIAFCLWGDNPKYTVGAIKNAELLEKIYPGWIARFYCGTSVPEDIILKLKSIDNVEVVCMNEKGSWNGMFWRFYPASESDVDVLLSRDTDSRLSLREKKAVDIWLNSDKDFLSLRDHPYHNIPILGGMWGVKNSLLSNMVDMISEYSKGDFWQVDQNFLTKKIFPIVKNYMMVFDEFHGGLNFPTIRENYEFVGDVFDENDVRHPDYWKMVKNFI